MVCSLYSGKGEKGNTGSGRGTPGVNNVPSESEPLVIISNTFPFTANSAASVLLTTLLCQRPPQVLALSLSDKVHVPVHALQATAVPMNASCACDMVACCPEVGAYRDVRYSRMRMRSGISRGLS